MPNILNKIKKTIYWIIKMPKRAFAFLRSLFRKIRRKRNEFSYWFVSSKVAFFWIAAIVIVPIILIVDWMCGKLFDADHWENVLVEAHGMLFDIFIFGILLTIYENLNEKEKEKQRKLEEERQSNEKQKRDKELKIERLFEEIEDFKNWGSEEGVNRIVGSIRRLNRLGLNKFELFQAKLSGADFSDANLEGSKFSQCKLQNVNFNGVRMRNVNLDMADLSESNFFQSDLQGSHILAAKFENATFRLALMNNTIISRADFENADLSGSYFQGCNCKGTIFTGANLSGVKFNYSILQGAVFWDAKVTNSTDFENCKVQSLNWIEEIKNQRIENFHCIEELFYVDSTKMIEKNSRGVESTYYLILRKDEKTTANKA